MIDRPDPSLPSPPYRQIADGIRSRVSVGALGAGTLLPSTRDAAVRIGVNRHTVARAYRELAAAGVLERAARGRFTIAGSAAVPAPPEEVRRFVDSILQQAAEARISPDTLLEQIDARSRADQYEVIVVECTDDQCDDLRVQIQREWDVRCVTHCLHADVVPVDLPPGLIVSTLAHVTDVRERWPERVASARFLTTGVCRSVAMIVTHLLRAEPSSPLRLIVQHDRTGGRALAATIARECEIEAHRIEVLTSAERKDHDGVTIATPHAFAELPPVLRSSPRCVRIRYAVSAGELDAIAATFSWRRREHAAIVASALHAQPALCDSPRFIPPNAE